LWWKHVSSLKAATNQQNNSAVRYTQSEQALWASLEKAINKNIHTDIQKYLSLWLGHYVQDKQAPLAQSLKVIDNQSLDAAVNALLASRYAKRQNQWQSTELQQILRKMRKSGSIKKQTKHNLSPLYPNS